MTIMEYSCSDCGRVVEKKTPYCPECGSEDSWEEQPAYFLKRDNFPFVFSYEVRDIDCGLWRTFCEEYFGKSDLIDSKIGNVPPNFPRMVNLEVDLWFKITKECDLKGPFLTQQDAEDA